MLFQFCPRCTSTKITETKAYRIACNHCGFVYYHNVAAAVAVVLRYKDQVLFTVRQKDPDAGTLDLPGGFIDPGERAEAAACREIKEELGITLDPRKLKYITTAANNYLYKSIPYKTLDIFYEYELENPKVGITAAYEIASLQWCHPPKMDLNAIGFISIRKVIGEYYSL